MKITYSDIGREVVLRNGDIAKISRYVDGDCYPVKIVYNSAEYSVRDNGQFWNICGPTEKDAIIFHSPKIQKKENWRGRAIKAEKELAELKAKIQALL